MSTAVAVDVNGETFRVTGQVTTRNGWRDVYAVDDTEEAGEGVAIESPEIEGAELAVDAARVMAAIAELPAPQRAALALFYTEDLSVAEIAVALDVPPGTVKTRLMHARRKVRAILGG